MRHQRAKQVIGTTRLGRFVEFDEAIGRLTCKAGASLESIIETFAPLGWFPMITPGTKFVTVGGCVNAVIQSIQAAASPIGHYETFFYPLDKIAKWNRGYGRRGFTQYQFVIPFENGLAQMRKILTAILSSGELPFLNVLKGMGKESGGILSFPREGYTFPIDFPVRKTTPDLLRRLDRMVIEAGGCIYLGKDSYTDAATFRTMYPEVDGWLATKAKYDPNSVFTSNLGHRVGLA